MGPSGPLTNSPSVPTEQHDNFLIWPNVRLSSSQSPLTLVCLEISVVPVND